MGADPSIESALARLTTALDTLEAAVNRRTNADDSLTALTIELQRLGEDRSQMAQDLDSAKARGARLEDVNQEVSRRLVTAMESIRSVLDAHGR